jgi:hypothetical protein
MKRATINGYCTCTVSCTDINISQHRTARKNSGKRFVRKFLSPSTRLLPLFNVNILAVRFFQNLAVRWWKGERKNLNVRRTPKYFHCTWFKCSMNNAPLSIKSWLALLSTFQQSR